MAVQRMSVILLVVTGAILRRTVEGEATSVESEGSVVQAVSLRGEWKEVG